MKWFGNRLFEAILSAVITYSGMVSIITFFCKWLNAKYSLGMPGWAWMLIALGISTIPALIVFWAMRRKPYDGGEIRTDKVDIRNELKRWFEHFRNQHLSLCGCQETLYLPSLDQELGLVSGSTNRYIEQIVKEFPGWGTKDKGKDTIIIFQSPIMRL